jgi:hypothetical protein
MRLRIIRLLFDEQLTNRDLARRLDADPATTLHHVRTLVRTGFIEPLAERTGARGAREVPYRSTGKSWQLDFSGVAAPLSNASIQAFVEEVAESPVEEVQVTRMALRLRPQRAEELMDRLSGVIRDYIDGDEGPDAQPWAAFVAMHPRAVAGAATSAARTSTASDRPREPAPRGRGRPAAGAPTPRRRASRSSPPPR